MAKQYFHIPIKGLPTTDSQLLVESSFPSRLVEFVHVKGKIVVKFIGGFLKVNLWFIEMSVTYVYSFFFQIYLFVF